MLRKQKPGSLGSIVRASDRRETQLEAGRTGRSARIGQTKITQDSLGKHLWLPLTTTLWGLPTASGILRKECLHGCLSPGITS